MEVKVIERKQASGNRTLYLEYYETGFRKRENLHLTIYPEDGNAKLAKINKEIRHQAEVIRSERILNPPSWLFKDPEEDAEEHVDERTATLTWAQWALDYAELGKQDGNVRNQVLEKQAVAKKIKHFLKLRKQLDMLLKDVKTKHISGAKKNGERPVLREAIERCKVEAQNLIPDSGMRSCVILLVSELSRLGRNAFEVLETVKELTDNGINLYMQKEQMTLLGDDGKPSIFAPIMLATLSTCAQLERDNISFRLNSGRKQYVEKGGKLGRPVGSTKSQDKKREEYREVINLLNKGYAIRDVAKLTGKGICTVQRVKKEFVT